MGSQNHIYSKKKLIKLKQGQSAGRRLQPGRSPAITLTTRKGKAGCKVQRGGGKLPTLGGCLRVGIRCRRGCGVESQPTGQGSTK